MKHVSEYDLALYAGKDLGWFDNLKIAMHVRSCTACRAQLEEFRELRSLVKDTAEPLPENLDWDRLSAEMTANIHLGLAAGECVSGPVRTEQPKHLTGWRPVGVFAAAAAVIFMAWLVNAPVPKIPTNMVAKQQPPVASTTVTIPVQGVLLSTSSSSIKVNDHGRELSLMHPDDENSAVVYSVSLQGSVRARYVDSETGQVTINNAYVQ